MDISVFYEDTDCGGVVYYANYLKYFERGRTELLENAGFPLATWMEEGFVFTVVQCEIFYRSPAKYRDLLKVDTLLTEATRTILTFRYKILEKKTERVVADGMTKLVCVGLNGKVKRLPQERVERLNSIIKQL